MRSGHIDGLGDYLFHSAGCRFELDSGEEIDFDWTNDGEVIFDVWRLRHFARSVAAEDLSDSQLERVCEELTQEGMVVALPNKWFRIKA